MRPFSASLRNNFLSLALGVGGDSVWEQKNEARKMLDSHKSVARFVGQTRWAQDSPTEKDNAANPTKSYTQL
ncbi:MAG TPA: hypothetical protein PLQ94_06255, partial [Anaerolineales bacterium]|nr:hypothetical protein [Anaerolineales bacterium]